MKNKNGQLTTYRYTNNGLASSVTDPLSHMTSTTYTATNKPSLVTDALGHRSSLPNATSPLTYTYDASDNLKTTTDALNRTTYLDNYNAYGLPGTVADDVQKAAGVSTQFSYDTFGNLITVTDATGRASTSTYNLLGWKLTSTTGFQASDYSALQTSAMRYDEWGRVKAVSGPPAVGLALYRCVDKSGNLLPLLDSNLAEYGGDITGTTWVPLGPVGGVYDPFSTAPYGTVPLYRFVNGNTGQTNTNDRVYSLSSTPPSGYTLEKSSGVGNNGNIGFVYQSAPGSPAVKPLYELYSPGTGRHIYTDDLDEYNRYPSGYTTRSTVCYLISNTATTQYDLNGNVLTATDANGHSVTNVYDVDDRLTQTTNANNETSQYFYGEDPSLTQPDPRHGLLAYKKDGNGNRTDYAYTARNEVNLIRYPMQHGQPNYLYESFTFDGDGNMRTDTKRDNHTKEYTYDAADRLTGIGYFTNYFNADGTVNSNPTPTSTHTVQFGYDAADRRTSMTDGSGGNGLTTWTYENNNLLKTIGSPQGTVNYVHNDAANRLTQRYIGTGSPGQVWNYGYDPANRPQTLAGPDGTTTYTYDTAGRVKNFANGNGVYTNFIYNAAGLVEEINHAPSATASPFAFYDNSYDAAGNLLERDEGYGATTTYAYDATDQLMQETRNAPLDNFSYSLSYTYDSNHNRRTATKNGTGQTYAYDTDDELLTRGSVTYTYDLNGNQTGDGTSSQTWDDEDRLVTWSGGGKSDRYYYNGLGLRVDKEESTTGSHSLLMDGSSPASPVLYDNNVSTVFTPGLSQNQGGVSAYYHADTIGSTRLMTDVSQDTTASLLFDGFGESVSVGGTTPTEAQYAGAEGYRTDGDSGLVLCGNRYYNPATGRFLSQDPIHSGNNWYDYAGNNPLTHTDPTGLLAAGSDGRHDMGDMWASYLATDNGYDNSHYFDENVAMAMAVDYNKLQDEAASTTFGSADAIAKWILKDAIGFTDYYGVEIGSFILKDDSGKYSLGDLVLGTGIQGTPQAGGSAGDDPLGVAPWDAVGDWHTHVHAPVGFADNFFSPADISNAASNNFQHNGWLSYLGVIDTAQDGSATDYEIKKYNAGTQVTTTIWSGPPNPHSSL